MYFYFEQVFRNAVNGINATAVPSTMVQIGGAILIVCLIFNVYEAWARGGDVRMLGIGAVKYLTFGLILLNYGAIFLGVNTMFNQVAEFISSVGPGGTDVFKTWLHDVGGYTQTSPNFLQSVWPAVSGGIPGVLETVFLLIGYVVYAITYPLFCIFYAFYGSVLYVCAPLVLALYPALSTTGIARTYLTNLLIFHAWGLIYAILGCLMSAIHLGTVADVLARGDAGGFFAGTGEALLLGLASILLALCIALIPMIARRIVQGDVGSTLFAVMSTAMTVATLGASMAINGGVGLARGVTGGNNDHGGGGGGSGGGKGPGGKDKPSAADQSSQKPPTPPAEPADAPKGTDAGDSGSEGKAPTAAKETETANPNPDATAKTADTADQTHGATNDGGGANPSSRTGRTSSHGSSARGSHWSSGARLYTPMSLLNLGAMGAGTLLGAGLRMTGKTLRLKSAGQDEKEMV